MDILRSKIIRLASTLPKGSKERILLLATLKTSKGKSFEDAASDASSEAESSIQDIKNENDELSTKISGINQKKEKLQEQITELEDQILSLTGEEEEVQEEYKKNESIMEEMQDALDNVDWAKLAKLGAIERKTLRIIEQGE